MRATRRVHRFAVVVAGIVETCFVMGLKKEERKVERRKESITGSGAEGEI